MISYSPPISVIGESYIPATGEIVNYDSKTIDKEIESMFLTTGIVYIACLAEALPFGAIYDLAQRGFQPFLKGNFHLIDGNVWALTRYDWVKRQSKLRAKRLSNLLEDLSPQEVNTSA